MKAKLFRGRWLFGIYEMVAYESSEKKLLALMEKEFYKWCGIEPDTETHWHYHDNATPREYFNYYKDEIGIEEISVGSVEIR